MSITEKEKLICDIQNLLNSYEGLSKTTINPLILSYMNEDELKSIISDLLKEKEDTVEKEMQWLQTFKKEEK